MNIKIEVDDFEIINSGSIIVENNQVINFNFKDTGLDLNFKIKFTEDSNISDSKFELNVNKENNYLEINIINTGYGLNMGNQNIIPLATISNRQLYLKFMVSSIQNGDDKDNLFNYTWYLKNEINGGK